MYQRSFSVSCYSALGRREKAQFKREGLPFQSKGTHKDKCIQLVDLEIMQTESQSEDACLCSPNLFFALIYLFAFLVLYKVGPGKRPVPRI